MPIDSFEHRSGIVPTLQNTMVAVNLGCKLDLKHIALHALHAEYIPKCFSIVFMRIKYPKTTALIFQSRKLVCIGVKTEDQTKLAARKYRRIVQKLGYTTKFTNFKIQNVVASCDVQFPIRLEKLSSDHHRFGTYEPELFPGLVYRMIQPKIVSLVFVFGKVVITGAKTKEDIYVAFEKLYHVIQQYRKVPVE